MVNDIWYLIVYEGQMTYNLPPPEIHQSGIYSSVHS